MSPILQPETRPQTVDLEALLLRKAILCSARNYSSGGIGGYVERSIRVGETIEDYGHLLGRWVAVQIMSEKVGQATKPVEFAHPKGWWQTFKHEVMPKWFKWLFPVKWHTEVKVVDFTAHVLYPNFPALEPEYSKGHKLRFNYLIRSSTPIMMES